MMENSCKKFFIFLIFSLLYVDSLCMDEGFVDKNDLKKETDKQVGFLLKKFFLGTGNNINPKYSFLDSFVDQKGAAESFEKDNKKTLDVLKVLNNMHVAIKKLDNEFLITKTQNCLSSINKMGHSTKSTEERNILDKDNDIYTIEEANRVLRKGIDEIISREKKSSESSLLANLKRDQEINTVTTLINDYLNIKKKGDDVKKKDIIISDKIEDKGEDKEQINKAEEDNSGNDILRKIKDIISSSDNHFLLSSAFKKTKLNNSDEKNKINDDILNSSNNVDNEESLKQKLDSLKEITSKKEKKEYECEKTFTDFENNLKLLDEYIKANKEEKEENKDRNHLKTNIIDKTKKIYEEMNNYIVFDEDENPPLTIEKINQDANDGFNETLNGLTSLKEKYNNNLEVHKEVVKELKKSIGRTSNVETEHFLIKEEGNKLKGKDDFLMMIDRTIEDINKYSNKSVNSKLLKIDEENTEDSALIQFLKSEEYNELKRAKIKTKENKKEKDEDIINTSNISSKSRNENPKSAANVIEEGLELAYRAELFTQHYNSTKDYLGKRECKYSKYLKPKNNTENVSDNENSPNEKIDSKSKKDKSYFFSLFVFRGLCRFGISFLYSTINSIMQFERKDKIGPYSSLYTLSYGKISQPSFFPKNMYIDVSLSLLSFFIFTSVDRAIERRLYNRSMNSTNKFPEFLCLIKYSMNAFNININIFVTKDFYMSFNIMSIFDSILSWYWFKESNFEQPEEKSKSIEKK